MSVRCSYLIPACVSTSNSLFTERDESNPAQHCPAGIWICHTGEKQAMLSHHSTSEGYRARSRLCTVFYITGGFKNPSLNILPRVVTSEIFRSNVRREEAGRERLLFLGDKRYFCSSKPCCLVRNSYRALIFITLYQSVTLKLISVKRN